VAALKYPASAWTRHRSLPEKDGDERNPAEIDRSRILHSAAFRRLAGKTQIFGLGQDAFFRSRLTHSLEVAQIAKGIALRVGADVEVCEAAALAHDIGHPPFGHHGETVLADKMNGHGGFEANAQNFRILCEIEVKYQDEPGLNLTRTVLDALLKYRVPFGAHPRKFYYTDDPRLRNVVEWAMQGFPNKSFECQIMDWADDIAYSCHDLEDGLHAGMISRQRLMSYGAEIIAAAQANLADCTDEDFAGVLAIVTECEAGGDVQRVQAARKSRISLVINELLQVGRKRRIHPAGTSGVPVRHQWDLEVAPELRRRCEMLKSAAFVLLVNDPRVASLEARAEIVLPALLDQYRAAKAAPLYPEPYRTRFRQQTLDDDRARVACDFIAGMTDDYAERVYSRIFSGTRSALADY